MLSRIIENWLVLCVTSICSFVTAFLLIRGQTTSRFRRQHGRPMENLIYIFRGFWRETPFSTLWWYGLQRFATALTFAGLLLSVKVEMDDTASIYYSLTQKRAAVVAHVASQFIVHTGAARAYPNEYFLWQPFGGTPGFIVHQALSWTVFGFVTMVQTILVLGGGQTYQPIGWFLVTSVAQCFSHIMLRSSLFYVKQSIHGTSGAAMENCQRHVYSAAHSIPYSQYHRLSKQDVAELDELSLQCKSDAVRDVLRQLTAAMVASTPLDNGVNQVSSAVPSAGGASGTWEVNPVGVLLAIVSSFFANLSLVFFAMADWMRGSFAALSHQSEQDALTAAAKPSCSSNATQINSATMYTPDLVELSSLMFAGAVVCAIIGCVCTHGFAGSQLYRGKYHLFQPFQGGLKFVLLQAISWTMFGIGTAISATCFSFGIENINVDGLVSGVGLVWYTAQLVLLFSLGFFEPSDENRFIDSNTQFDSSSSDGETIVKSLYGSRRLSVLLSFGGMALFLCANVAMVQYGLSMDVVKPVVLCGLLAIATSVPFTIYVEFKRDHTRATKHGDNLSKWQSVPRILRYSFRGRFLLRIAGLSLWMFTMLVGLLVLASTASPAAPMLSRDVEMNATEAIWGPTWLKLGLPTFLLPKSLLEALGGNWFTAKTGLAGFVAQLFVVLGNPKTWGLRHIITFWFLGPSLTYVVASVFVWTVLPWLRLFLDWPMYYYAVVMKRVPGWVSPDGKQALQGVHVRRALRYGPERGDLLDVLSPMCPRVVQDPHAPLGTASSPTPPVIYCHGGAHICVNRELIHHSVTPFCRSGLTVYSIEYPLSPDVRFPGAILKLLTAMCWVAKHHCQRGCHDATHVGVQDPDSSHECGVDCDGSCASNLSYQGEDGCRRCTNCHAPTGCSEVFLFGDSAGGNMVSMATLILSNHVLLESLMKTHDLEACGIDVSSIPTVNRLVCMYGLLGRQSALTEYHASEQHTNTSNLDGDTPTTMDVRGITHEVSLVVADDLSIVDHIVDFAINMLLGLYAPAEAVSSNDYSKWWTRIPSVSTFRSWISHNQAYQTVGNKQVNSRRGSATNSSSSDSCAKGSFPYDGRVTLTDFGDELFEHFQPKETLLICGVSDPLIYSNRHANSLLQRNGHPCQLNEYPGTHAFQGFPPLWTPGWTRNALPATYDVLEFFTKDCDFPFKRPQEQVKEQRWYQYDFSPLVVFPLCLGCGMLFTLWLFQGVAYLVALL